MNAHSRKLYWELVRQCLHELHGVAISNARIAAAEYRGQMKLSGIEHITYNDEPYDVACVIACVNPIYQGEQWQHYWNLRDRYFPRTDAVDRSVSEESSIPQGRTKSRVSRSAALAATGTEGKRYSKPSAIKRSRTKQVAPRKPAAKKSAVRKASGARRGKTCR